jgi:hypothetical protein
MKCLEMMYFMLKPSNLSSCLYDMIVRSYKIRARDNSSNYSDLVYLKGGSSGVN